MNCCEICGSSENIDKHHVSYEPEETVGLCRSCHQEVHADEGHEYYPDDRPDRSTISISPEQKAQLDELKLVDDESYKSVLQRLMDDHEGPQVEHEPREEIIEDIRNQLSMAPEYGIDEEQIVEQVSKRLDDLETELKTELEALQRP